jgi:hypothetical protein
MLKKRTFEIVWVNKAEPLGLDLDGPAAESVQYDGSKLVIKQKK